MARPRTRITKNCEKCGTAYEVVPSLASGSRFCSATCRNLAGADVVRKPPTVCPCGKEIPDKRKHTSKYCDSECRKIHGKKKQRDPANYVTFNCERCGVEVTRYKGYGNGANRFCSNECSARSNTQRHIGVNDVVLDSGWEALVYGLCCFHKVVIERFDRAQCIEHGDGHYGPDFVIAGHYVEVKGLEDDDDRGRYDAWRAEMGHLVVLSRSRIHALMSCSDGAGLLTCLSNWTY